MMVSKTFLRACHFEVASTMVHGAIFGLGQLQHLLDGGQVLVVFLVARPVGVGHAPGFQRILLNRLEALLLFLLADVQEELQDDGAVVGQHALELRRCRGRPRCQLFSGTVRSTRSSSTRPYQL